MSLLLAISDDGISAEISVAVLVSIASECVVELPCTSSAELTTASTASGFVGANCGVSASIASAASAAGFVQLQGAVQNAAQVAISASGSVYAIGNASSVVAVAINANCAIELAAQISAFASVACSVIGVGPTLSYPLLVAKTDSDTHATIANRNASGATPAPKSIASISIAPSLAVVADDSTEATT